MDFIPSTVFTVILYIAFAIAVIGILLTHIRAVIFNHDKWEKKADSTLTFSYFYGTGLYRWGCIYKDAFKFLIDKTWLLLSAAGAGYRLGNYKSESRVRLFLLSLIHIPLTIVGFFEMIFRVVLGVVYLSLAGIVHGIVLVVLYVAALTLIPIWSFVDQMMRNEQHCTYCYRTFRLPGYVCPSCGRVHKDLAPARTGVLFSRCECGRMLPSALAMGRAGLDGVCPECGRKLAAADAREFTLQLIGGNASGKTAYLAAFQHVYLHNESIQKSGVRMAPKEASAALEGMFSGGCADAQTTTTAYSLVHSFKNGDKHSLVIYDIPDEDLLRDINKQNPLHFAYTDGIVIIVDPLSVKSVREACAAMGEAVEADSYSTDETEDVIVTFIQQFSRIVNRSSSKMLHIPVAVAINKADMKGIDKKIGADAVRTEYRADPEKYHENLDEARNKICRDYMVSIGLSNALNNLESVFSNVQYFAVSAMGHPYIEGRPFKPKAVIEPISWVCGKKAGRIALLLQTARNTAT